MNHQPLTILVCPLDWGLGHASRLIPVIRRIRACGHKVLMAGTGRSGELLRISFPDLDFIDLPSARIRFGSSPMSHIMFILRIPAFIIWLLKEHRMLARMVREKVIDIVVSDNRYGLFSKQAYCVFITHQLSPVLPVWLRFLEYPLYQAIKAIIHRFDECWIPDYKDPEDNLSGILSHRFKIPQNARFIGMLSRFEKTEIAGPEVQKRFDVVAVLSGPEPQIVEFEDLLIDQLENTGINSMIIKGLQRSDQGRPERDKSNITFRSHLDDREFATVLRNAGLVICRAGYSGIMDLITLGVHAVLVPTRGQTEQEYLARYMSRKKWFRIMEQGRLNLQELIFSTERGKLPDFSHRVSWDFLNNLYGKYADGDQHSGNKS